ncbi:MAG: sensor histidine kinase [Lachnospiraceae bacterium]
MRYVNNYVKKTGKYIAVIIFTVIIFILYFVYLVPGIHMQYLQYFLILLLSTYVILVLCDFHLFLKQERHKQELLLRKGLIIHELEQKEGYELVEHDVRILKAQLEEEYQKNCNLQDYITKWTHEVKIPLAASMLITEHIEADDNTIKYELQEQLERMTRQLNMVLLGCKMQSSVFDMNIRKTNVMECVRTSIHNNQFFLMKNQFQLEVNVEEFFVYSDSQWLTYILDQLFSNAIKYSKEEPLLKIWSDNQNLYIEDHGEGIQKQDIKRIFERGYTGTNHHNGMYKSTGMGLYMVDSIAKKLGHDISVESEIGEFTRFQITFHDNRGYFMES